MNIVQAREAIIKRQRTAIEKILKCFKEDKKNNTPCTYEFEMDEKGVVSMYRVNDYGGRVHVLNAPTEVAMKLWFEAAEKEYYEWEYYYNLEN